MSRRTDAVDSVFMVRPAARVDIEILGRRDYREVWDRMRSFTDARDDATRDALWIVEHPPVFTLGQGGRAEHLIAPGRIPVIKCDRGGQVTYHGPGQIIVYTLLDLRRLGIGIRTLVERLERAGIEYLAALGVEAERRSGAPGVYVAGAKVAALGLRVRRGRTYHGIALNVDMDLAPFLAIDPCGYKGLEVTSLARLGVGVRVLEAGEGLARSIALALGLECTPVAWRRARRPVQGSAP